MSLIVSALTNSALLIKLVLIFF